MEPPTTLPAWSHRIVTMAAAAARRNLASSARSRIGRDRGAGSMLWTGQPTALMTPGFNTPGFGGAALQRAALQLAGLQ